MAHERLIVAPRQETQGSSRDGGRTTRLPDELLTEQLRRIGLFAAVTGGLWTLGLFLDTVMAPIVWRRPILVPAVALEVTGIAGALLMVWYVRSCAHSPQTAPLSPSAKKSPENFLHSGNIFRKSPITCPKREFYVEI